MKGRVLAISKSDMIDDKAKSEIEARLPEDVPHIFFSSKTGENVRQLKELLWTVLHEKQDN